MLSPSLRRVLSRHVGDVLELRLWTDADLVARNLFGRQRYFHRRNPGPQYRFTALPEPRVMAAPDFEWEDGAIALKQTIVDARLDALEQTRSAGRLWTTLDTGRGAAAGRFKRCQTIARYSYDPGRDAHLILIKVQLVFRRPGSLVELDWRVVDA